MLIERNITLQTTDSDIEVYIIGIAYHDVGIRVIPSFRLAIFEKLYKFSKFWEKCELTIVDKYMQLDNITYLIDSSHIKDFFDKSLAEYAYSEQSRIYKVTIPKGSKYFKTKEGIYISDQFIIHDSVLEYYPKIHDAYLGVLNNHLPEFYKYY